LAPVIGLFAGIGLGAVFLIPMVLERQYVRQDQWFDGRYDFHGNFVYFFQLFSPQWGFGASQPGPTIPSAIRLVRRMVLAVLGVLLVWPRVDRQRWEIADFASQVWSPRLPALQWASSLWDLPLIGTILGLPSSHGAGSASQRSASVFWPDLIGHRVLGR
jgi:hypothetical protein